MRTDPTTQKLTLPPSSPSILWLFAAACLKRDAAFALDRRGFNAILLKSRADESKCEQQNQIWEEKRNLKNKKKKH